MEKPEFSDGIWFLRLILARPGLLQLWLKIPAGHSDRSRDSFSQWIECPWKNWYSKVFRDELILVHVISLQWIVSSFAFSVFQVQIRYLLKRLEKDGRSLKNFVCHLFLLAYTSRGLFNINGMWSRGKPAFFPRTYLKEVPCVIEHEVKCNHIEQGLHNDGTRVIDTFKRFCIVQLIRALDI